MSEEKLTYVVVVMRKDFNHIAAMETDNFDEAKTHWRKLADEYKVAATDNVPFEMEKPIVTSFDPGLISEITIQVQPKETVNNKLGEHNPYVEQTRNEGLNNTMKFRGAGSDVLDGGYK